MKADILIDAIGRIDEDLIIDAEPNILLALCNRMVRAVPKACACLLIIGIFAISLPLMFRKTQDPTPPLANPHPFATALREFFEEIPNSPDLLFYEEPAEWEIRDTAAFFVDIDGNGTVGVVAYKSVGIRDMGREFHRLIYIMNGEVRTYDFELANNWHGYLEIGDGPIAVRLGVGGINRPMSYFTYTVTDDGVFTTASLFGNPGDGELGYRDEYMYNGAYVSEEWFNQRLADYRLTDDRWLPFERPTRANLPQTLPPSDRKPDTELILAMTADSALPLLPPAPTARPHPIAAALAEFFCDDATHTSAFIIDIRSGHRGVAAYKSVGDYDFYSIFYIWNGELRVHNFSNEGRNLFELGENNLATVSGGEGAGVYYNFYELNSDGYLFVSTALHESAGGAFSLNGETLDEARFIHVLNGYNTNRYEFGVSDGRWLPFVRSPKENADRSPAFRRPDDSAKILAMMPFDDFYSLFDIFFDGEGVRGVLYAVDGKTPSHVPLDVTGALDLMVMQGGSQIAIFRNEERLAEISVINYLAGLAGVNVGMNDTFMADDYSIYVPISLFRDMGFRADVYEGRVYIGS
jgi:hypothetical protein